MLGAAAEAGGDSVEDEDERMRTHASGGFLKAGVPPSGSLHPHELPTSHWLGLKFMTLF